MSKKQSDMIRTIITRFHLDQEEDRVAWKYLTDEKNCTSQNRKVIAALRNCAENRDCIILSPEQMERIIQGVSVNLQDFIRQYLPAYLTGCMDTLHFIPAHGAVISDIDIKTTDSPETVSDPYETPLDLPNGVIDHLTF